MANNFQLGMFSPVAWTPAGGNPATLNIKDHDLALSALLIDVTGTAALGVRARVAGPLDADGMVHASLDLDAPPWANIVNIVPGVRGIASFFLGAVKTIQVPLSVEKLHFVSAVEKEVMWDFSTKMNSLSGLVVYPAFP